MGTLMYPGRKREKSRARREAEVRGRGQAFPITWYLTCKEEGLENVSWIKESKGLWVDSSLSWTLLVREGMGEVADLSGNPCCKSCVHLT